MPSFTYQQLTELEAVNIMLSTIGESPVSTLASSGDLNVSVARQMLYDVSREVQTEGWYFNTEVKYPLPRSSDKTISLPANLLGLDLTDDFVLIDATPRGSRMYDRKNHSYVFDRDLEADITLFLTWDELPQAAKQYITIVAARRFQKRLLPDDYTSKFTQDEETKARAQLDDYDANTRDYSLADNYNVFFILER
jgi:hypothetical protein